MLPLQQSHIDDITSQLESATTRLADTTAAVASLSAAAEEAQKDMQTKAQQIAQLQMSLSDAEEQLANITAREARSSDAETRR